MKEIRRQSAVQFEAEAAKEKTLDDWKIVLQYRDEGQGPWLVDLAHKRRFDLQENDIGRRTLGDIPMPATPGDSRYHNGILVNRMNATQASIYCLGDDSADVEIDGAFTDISESTVFMALFGDGVFFIAEKLSALDFLAPGIKVPFLYQGPLCHVPCQVAVLQKDADKSGGFLLACSRGYAQSIVKAILHGGEEFGLRPAGEEKFADWLGRIRF